MSTYGPYRPSVPAPLPPGYPLPGPRRPGVVSVLGWVAVTTLIVGSGLLTLVAITNETGSLGLLTGAVLAAVPVFPVVATYLWLDRYEAEPKSLLAFAFGWGAAVGWGVGIRVGRGAGVLLHASAASARMARGSSVRRMYSLLVDKFLPGLQRGFRRAIVDSDSPRPHWQSKTDSFGHGKVDWLDKGWSHRDLIQG